MKPDFSGYATVPNVRCSDGRTIRPGAFRGNDKGTVPLVWQHRHNDPGNVLGHAVLEDRGDKGVYCYGYLNSTDTGKRAAELISHGDVTALSIYANELVQDGDVVTHGSIREVSLVLAGANPGARIDNLTVVHSDGYEEYMGDEAVITIGSSLAHEDEPKKEPEEDDGQEPPSDEEDLTVGELLDSLTPAQMAAVDYVITELTKGEDSEEDESGEEESEKTAPSEKKDTSMHHSNVFEKPAIEDAPNILQHDVFKKIMADVAEGRANWRDSVLRHADEYGFKTVTGLFPDAKELNTPPAILQRRKEWVNALLNGTTKVGMSRLRATFTDTRDPEARARGYAEKGGLKKDQVFKWLRRTTTPTTVYAKSRMDRDDILDITDFDALTYLASLLRLALEEEVARAILLGDGRQTTDKDHIDTDCVRPVLTDPELYTIHRDVSGGAAKAVTPAAIADAVVLARKEFEGNGTPVMFATSDLVATILTTRDALGRRVYPTLADFAAEARVSAVYEVQVMDSASRTDSGTSKKMKPLAIVLNPADYTNGSTRGGEITSFNDFDINHNQQVSLFETRLSGSLLQPKTAIAIEGVEGTTITPDAAPVPTRTVA